MNIIKRTGKEVPFEPERIRNAILKAGFVPDNLIKIICNLIKDQVEDGTIRTVEDIQDAVEKHLIAIEYPKVAINYIRYRKTRELIRNSEQTNESILKLIDDKNDYLKTENSNKNHRIASTQRDYIAGEVSKDITMRLLLSPKIVEAHKKGVIHFHK